MSSTMAAATDDGAAEQNHHPTYYTMKPHKKHKLKQANTIDDDDVVRDYNSADAKSLLSLSSQNFFVAQLIIVAAKICTLLINLRDPMPANVPFSRLQFSSALGDSHW